MSPAHLKLFLLVMLMLGVGGYVLYSTTPAPKKIVQPIASSTSTLPLPNVTNVHIEKNGTVVTVTGQEADEVDPSLTDVILQGMMATSSFRMTFSRMSADVFVQNRGLHGGSVTVDVSGLTTGKSDLDRRLLSVFGSKVTKPEAMRAQFVIAQVIPGRERGAIAVGTLTLNQMSQEIQVPFVREGGGLRGQVPIDVTKFGLSVPGLSSLQLQFLLGVK